jgi:hypothetical protein
VSVPPVPYLRLNSSCFPELVSYPVLCSAGHRWHRGMLCNALNHTANTHTLPLDPSPHTTHSTQHLDAQARTVTFRALHSDHKQASAKPPTLMQANASTVLQLCDSFRSLTARKWYLIIPAHRLCLRYVQACFVRCTPHKARLPRRCIQEAHMYAIAVYSC